MAFKSSANGVQKSGKTKGKQLGIDGAKLPVDGGVSKGNKASTVTTGAMKSMGRNLARAANQKG
jgi:hypothetical protein